MYTYYNRWYILYCLLTSRRRPGTLQRSTRPRPSCASCGRSLARSRVESGLLGGSWVVIAGVIGVSLRVPLWVPGSIGFIGLKGSYKRL